METSAGAHEGESPSDRERVLKRGRSRTVLLAMENGRDVVLKRFHHPSPLKRWRDGWRARTELRALERLERHGVRVPHPLGIVRTPSGPEVRMEAVPGATSLEALLTGASTRALDWERFLPRLGDFLARLYRAPIDHTDLHPGNVLVDAEDQPWLIDFHAARLRRGAGGAERWTRDLVRAAAFAREALSARQRLRFTAAWRRALPARLQLPALDELEQRARLERRAAVESGSGRWLRTSSRCLAERQRLEARWPPRPAADELPTFQLASPLPEARARWRSAARCVEHGIPVAVPLLLEADAHGARATYADRAACTVRCDAPEGAGPVALGHVLGLLHDRGLDVPGLAPEALRPSGLLDPPLELRPLDPRTARGRFRGLAAASAPGFRAAYLAAFDDRPAERERVAALTR